MSQILIRPEVKPTLTKASQILRYMANIGTQQFKGFYFDEKREKFCALGAIGEYFDSPITGFVRAGISVKVFGTVATMNDDGKSFYEIADYLESINL